MSAGTLHIGARHDGTRTVVDRLRYDGLARCSRTFYENGVAKIVTAQLGPGVIHGDDVVTTGRVDDGAHLIVTQQTATRVLGGARTARAFANWTVGSGAMLELIGEPLVAAGDAGYEATVTIVLKENARALIADIAHVPADANVRLRTLVTRAGRDVLYDAVDAQAAAPAAVGTLAYVGLDETEAARCVAALDDAARSITNVRIGIGLLPGG